VDSSVEVSRQQLSAALLRMGFSDLQPLLLLLLLLLPLLPLLLLL
jgi:hypothetical protein